MNPKLSINRYLKSSMNRKERRKAKYSKKRKAAIAMLAAGLLALSPGLSTEVIADATDDLVIYGGGSGGGCGGSSTIGGGGGGYIGYGNAYIFAGGSDGYGENDTNPVSGVGGGGVGGGNSNANIDRNFPGGGNYLYNWGGLSGGDPGIGPNGIKGTGYKGASPSSLGSITIGTTEVYKGNYARGGNAKLTLNSDISVRNIEVLGGDRSNRVAYLDEDNARSMRGGEAVLRADYNKITAYGKIVIASGKPGTFTTPPSPIASGDVSAVINQLYLPKGGNDMEIFDGNSNLNVVIDTLTLADGAKLDGTFINSFEEFAINDIIFENTGSIVFTKNSGTFPSKAELLRRISTNDSGYTPNIVFSKSGNTETVTITVGEATTNKDNSTKPTKANSPQTGDLENILFWIVLGSIGVFGIVISSRIKVIGFK